jgi:hypothetical protein
MTVKSLHEHRLHVTKRGQKLKKISLCPYQQVRSNCCWATNTSRRQRALGRYPYLADIYTI